MAFARSHLVRASLLLLVVAALFAVRTEASEQSIVFPLVLNEVPKGDILVILDSRSVQVRAVDLEQAGLAEIGGERIRRGAEEWVVLSTVPDLTYRLDEEALVLRLEAAPHLLGTTTARLRGNAPVDLRYTKNPSAFFNYSMATTQFDNPTLALEAGGSWGTRYATTTVTRLPSGSAVRGLSRFVIDQPDRMSRWTFGDTQVATDPLGGSDLLGGVTYSRDFSLQPYFVRYPSFEFEGAAASPSEVEVYVNGVLSARRRVAPGEFRLQDLPLVAGSGDTRIVVRDSFGREQIYASPYYYSTLNLGKGISDFSYSIGFRRQELGRASFDYGDPALIAFHRKGVTEKITIGGRVEATEGLMSGGGSFTAALRFGEIEALVGASESDGRSGSAAALTYRWLARAANFGGTVRTYSDDYSNLSLSSDEDRVSTEASIFAGYRIGRGTVGARLAVAEYRDRGEEQRLTVNGNYTLTQNATLFVSAGHGEVAGESTTEVFAGVSILLNRFLSANVGASHRGDGTSVRLDVQRPLPVGTGYGYRIQSSVVDGAETASLAAQYQTDFGRYEVTVDPRDAENATLTASGGLVWIADRFLTTRAVQQSYALARVGVPEVRVYASNLEVGRTDAKGDLLIPNLLPYYANPIRIEDEDVPLAYEVAKVEEMVAPPVRGGALIEFPVQKIQTSFGTLRLIRGDETILPEFGQLTIQTAGKRWDSPIGRGGAFYLENVPSGKYDGTVLHKTGTCHFVLSIPDSNEQMLNLGELQCAMK